MNTMRLSHSVLVLVDYQQRLMPMISGGEAALAEALRVAEIARVLGVPVLGTEQNPAGLGPNADAVRQLCNHTMAKTHFGACADGLLGLVHEARPGLPPGAPRDVVIAGCETHVCLLQTALGLLDAGHRCWVVGEASGSRRPADHALGLERLQRAGATLVNREMVAFEWLGHCRHEAFKAVLPLLKAAPTSSS
jgi:nicotinamidase-related amidase